MGTQPENKIAKTKDLPKMSFRSFILSQNFLKLLDLKPKL